MVFSGLYPVDGDDYPDLRDALDKLRLNDAALLYEPETSDALGFGFRCGFLGLLHMEIVRERLEREFDLSLISTAPNAVYRVVMDTGQEIRVTNPSDFPGGSEPGKGKVDLVFEPVVRATVISPSDYIGAIMELCQSRRGTLIGMDYLSSDRVEIRYMLPLAEIIFDFFDQLKSRTRGYASLDYEPNGEQQADLVKVDILLQGQPWTRSARSCTPTTPGVRPVDDREAQGTDPAPAVRCLFRRPSAPGSSPGKTSARCARTCWPSAMAVTSLASASCWSGRRRARSG